MNFRNGDEKDIIFSKENQHFVNNDEIWDDTALIKMYEESIQKTYKKLEKEASSSLAESQNKQKKWHIGDLCLAPYYEDDLWYPAIIKEISSTDDTCIVSYEEYNELATVMISDLEPREDESEVSEEVESTKVPKPGKIKSYKKNAGNMEPNGNNNIPSSSGITPSVNKLDFSKGSASFEMPGVMPPPPLMFSGIPRPSDDEAVSNMLLSWYMCGYHTGYYQAIQNERKKKGSA